jgi:class 3 adenylate cyclase
MAEFDDQAMQAFLQELQSGSLTYDEAKQRYRELGDAIRRRYEREISALAVDVVESRIIKGADPLDAQLTFDAYHHWVEEVLAHFQCDGSHTWSGDGLLAVFTQPDRAVAAGRHLLDSLAMFNARYNRISQPLQIRIGVHTGQILTDEAAGLGKIASRTFDVAGHLQKSAAPNQMRISETTYTLLRECGAEFMQVPAELAATVTCYAYPPHLTLMGTGAPALPAPVMPGPSQSPPHPPTSSFVPWVLAAAGVALAVGVLLGVSALWSRPPASGPAGNGPTYRAEAQPPALPANSSLNAPIDTPPPTEPAPANAPSEPPAEAPLPAPPPTPPEWEPSRSLWRSADANSGLPPRLLPSPPEQKWLLAIGVGKYEDQAVQAPGAAEDTLLAADALRRGAGVPVPNSRVLVDGQATLGAIKRSFQWLQQSAASGKDTVFLYLAGAAMLAPGRSGAGSASGYAFFPHDVRLEDVSHTAVYGTDLAEWLGATRAQTIVLVLDTNHAAACELPASSDPGRGIALLTSAGVYQRARERRGQQAGAFAELFSAGLTGAADQDRDGRVSLPELKAYLEVEVGRATLGWQTPELRSGFGGDTPELFFSAFRR